MPAYNFKEAFAGAVQIGNKRQTIRRRRKRPTKIGDMLYLYTGMRTKKCRLLMATTCLLVEPIEMQVGGLEFEDRTVLVNSSKADMFAEDDGFNDSGEMIAWFTAVYGLPFSGEVIYW